ncbi:MAG: polar amino acid transport system substrate-binding protein [Gammaproteobacteria bacterium]|nr:polar amino acid transport system substrate-binding protein [Gammaproteobacteria bacterium]
MRTRVEPSSAAAEQLSMRGVMRAAINLGNPVLAQRHPITGDLTGVTVALATELAKRVGRRLVLAPFDAAGKVVDARHDDAWDVAFLAIDPKRAEEIAFSDPYILIEGVYVVAAAAPWTHAAELDRPDVRIAVGRGAAYDLHLQRSLKHAALVRFDTSQAALTGFYEQKLSAGAGVRQPALAFAAENPEVRVLEEPFMVIRQSVALPPGRPDALIYINAFLKEMKASGFVAHELARSGQTGARVAL